MVDGPTIYRMAMEIAPYAACLGSLFVAVPIVWYLSGKALKPIASEKEDPKLYESNWEGVSDQVFDRYGRR